MNGLFDAVGDFTSLLCKKHTSLWILWKQLLKKGRERMQDITICCYPSPPLALQVTFTYHNFVLRQKQATITDLSLYFGVYAGLARG